MLEKATEIWYSNVPVPMGGLKKQFKYEYTYHTTTQ